MIPLPALSLWSSCAFHNTKGMFMKQVAVITRESYLISLMLLRVTCILRLSVIRFNHHHRSLITFIFFTTHFQARNDSIHSSSLLLLPLRFGSISHLNPR